MRSEAIRYCVHHGLYVHIGMSPTIDEHRILTADRIN